MIKRLLKLPETNSFFLFGPRGAGKTSLLETRYSESDSLFVDLLDLKVFDQLTLDRSRFEAIIDDPKNINKRVIIDEVQKLPKLLDVVHSQIQKRKRQFILTGSSSRKLKQGGTNLLAGRAWVLSLHPLSWMELGDDFDLTKALERGGLPEAYTAEDDSSAKEFLMAYVGTYLQKEIQQEQWVRKLEPFRRFLAVAAQMNGEIVNKSKIALEVGVDDVTVANYFEILEDTLLGFFLPTFHLSVRKAQRQAPKFYFCDTGIPRALNRTLTVPVLPQTSTFGAGFEHWVILEIMKNASYKRLDWDFSYSRTKDDVEIDLIIKRPGQNILMIEIKSTEHVRELHCKALNTLGHDLDPSAEKWLISRDGVEQKFGNVRALHWQKAIPQMFEQ